jgi:hypothetical protein
MRLSRRASVEAHCLTQARVFQRFVADLHDKRIVELTDGELFIPMGFRGAGFDSMPDALRSWAERRLCQEFWTRHYLVAWLLVFI